MVDDADWVLLPSSVVDLVHEVGSFIATVGDTRWCLAGSVRPIRGLMMSCKLVTNTPFVVTIYGSSSLTWYIIHCLDHGTKIQILRSRKLVLKRSARKNCVVASMVFGWRDPRHRSHPAKKQCNAVRRLLSARTVIFFFFCSWPTSCMHAAVCSGQPRCLAALPTGSCCLRSPASSPCLHDKSRWKPTLVDRSRDSRQLSYIK